MPFWRKAKPMPTRAEALPGRATPLHVASKHFVLQRPMLSPYPAGSHQILFGMGCFWGAEKAFWSLPGLITTAVGYAGGYTENPTYEEVCTGLTGHTEVVLIVFDPLKINPDPLFQIFWEMHDPTQGMRQGNDVGTQYRSAIYSDDLGLLAQAKASALAYGKLLSKAGYGSVTTEISSGQTFYFAEDYHQQYLAKNPDGYCGLGGTGVSCPIGLTGQST